MANKRSIFDILGTAKDTYDNLKDPNVHVGWKAAYVAAMGAYALMPADILPDFLPILGALDDVVVMKMLTKGFNKIAEHSRNKTLEEQSQAQIEAQEPSIFDKFAQNEKETSKQSIYEVFADVSLVAGAAYTVNEILNQAQNKNNEQPDLDNEIEIRR